MAGKDRQTIFWGCMCLVAAFVLAGGRAPLVNEAHYLTKARHFWDSSWCPDDPFLRSADAHWGFYLTCGWLTQCTSLAISAYGLRFVAWGLLASGWVRLCRPLGLDGWRSFLAWLATLWLVDHGHLAGEWLIGGAEGKPFAYGFVFWALSFRAEGRWGATWIALGLAIWFHPVVGGWCTLGFVAVSLLDVGMVGHLRVPAPSRDPDARPDGSGGWPPWPTCGAALACLLAAAAIWPIFQAQFTVDRATATEAAVIQVYHRLPHHLLLHAMRPWHRWRFAMSVVVWLAAAWSWRRNPSQRMIHRFVGWTVILTVVGCLVDVATWNQPSAGAPLLKFYWFRLSDIFVPVGIGCSLAGWLQRAESRWSSGISAALLLCLVSWIAYEFGVRQTDSRPAADQQGDFGLRGGAANRARRYADWRELCRWAKTRSRYDALFLTPTRSQTFKWYAQRAELATWKDCPQDPEHVVSWWRLLADIRLLNLYHDGPRPTAESLQRFGQTHGIQYVIILRERDVGGFPLPHRFRNATFDVYDLLSN